MLEECLEAAGLTRREVFLTNAVKHFKWQPRGKRRLHVKPNLLEINACNIWLQQELDHLKPRVAVALGATALRALLGSTLTIDAARRRKLHHQSGVTVLATYHPSAILRARDAGRAELRALLITDLKRAARLSKTGGPDG